MQINKITILPDYIRLEPILFNWRFECAADYVTLMYITIWMKNQTKRPIMITHRKDDSGIIIMTTLYQNSQLGKSIVFDEQTSTYDFRITHNWKILYSETIQINEPTYPILTKLILSHTNHLDEPIRQLIQLTDNFIYKERYAHSNKEMYKINNEYTDYKEHKIVLCPVEYGIEKALKMAIETISQYKKDHEIQ